MDGCRSVNCMGCGVVGGPSGAGGARQLRQREFKSGGQRQWRVRERNLWALFSLQGVYFQMMRFVWMAIGPFFIASTRHAITNQDNIHVWYSGAWSSERAFHLP